MHAQTVRYCQPIIAHHQSPGCIAWVKPHRESHGLVLTQAEIMDPPRRRRLLRLTKLKVTNPVHLMSADFLILSGRTAFLPIRLCLWLWMRQSNQLWQSCTACLLALYKPSIHTHTLPSLPVPQIDSVYAYMLPSWHLYTFTFNAHLSHTWTHNILRSWLTNASTAVDLLASASKTFSSGTWLFCYVYFIVCFSQNTWTWNWLLVATEAAEPCVEPQI